MSEKTKNTVLHMKLMIFTAIMVALIFIILLALLLRTGYYTQKDVVPTVYVPGVYTSSVQLNDTSLDILVAVDENHINSISLVNLDETTEKMYPLIRPAFDDLVDQIVSTQSLDNITYSKYNQHTSMALLSAIEEALKKGASE